MKTEVLVDGPYKRTINLITYPEYSQNEIAQLATQFATKWGLVAAVGDGEDTSGRQKIRLLTEEEVVQRACKTAHLLWKEYKENDWLVKISDIEECRAIVEQRD